MKTKLTVKESARLIELGVDPKMASMVSWKQTEDWQRKSVLPNKEHLTLKPFRPMVMGFERFEVKDIFTLADLLRILPKEIKVDKVNLSLVMEWQCDKWYVCYMGHGYMKADHSAPELIDALNSLLIWVLENNLNQENQ